MKHLLPLMPKPSRYLGSEWGAPFKDPRDVSMHVALAFPDLYDVGMSYMGQRILAHAVNQVERFYAERAYAPCVEASAVLREHGAPLATLETDTPLKDLDAVAFSLTHELCYTNVLHMLDLAHIPLRAEDRDDSHPLIVAGGGACFNAEPLAPFVDLMVIGDGEAVLVELLKRLEAGKLAGAKRGELLATLRGMPGIYVPSLFKDQGPDNAPEPAYPDYARVEKAVVPDLADAPFPAGGPVSFGQAVHDRLTLEIARGCTRGCRFCQAGMIYRPVRERTPEDLQRLLVEGLADSGFEETSFLSLSTGDYSALDSLFAHSFDRCASEQVSIALPSLRVGSLSPAIMERIATIRRTGATLAPEAGTQRLRDVINKGVDEEGLLTHVRALFEHGWQQVKLYFMIGLPTETEEDLRGIVDLCLKVRDAAGRDVKRLQVTASASPFVPKPQTPFQWEEQIGLEEIRERIGFLRSLFRPHKRLKFKFHQPEMSYLEGVFSRGDRRLADVVETAFQKGALFTSWADQLDLGKYLEALAEHGLSPEEFLAARDPEAPLPWDHLSAGVRKQFLLKERDRALAGFITKDCRYHACRNCGVCNLDGRTSLLSDQARSADISPRMVFAERDQETEVPPPPKPRDAHLNDKGGHYRLWYEKTGPAAYLSQLELQSVFERALRRAGLPVSFSAGFHPMPRISFGKALPVSVASKCEWLNLFLREDKTPEQVYAALAGKLPRGLRPTRVERLSMGRKQPQPMFETYLLEFPDEEHAETLRNAWLKFAGADEFRMMRKTKRGEKEIDARPFLRGMEENEDGTLAASFDWNEGYLNPLVLARAVAPDVPVTALGLTKIRQDFEPED